MDKVIIAGGGLAGLLLAILLERASIDYVVLERSPVAKMPLEGGGVIWITSQFQPLLQQLGLLDSLRNMSKPMSRITVLDGAFSFSRYGYHSLSISRPELYNYLVDQIPAEKILLGKQVIDIHQDDFIATCTCTDDSNYQGIVIGADGAYSNVRLNLYQQLKKTDELPACDRKPMRYEYRSLVGMTHPLDPERFPLIKEEHSDTRVLVSHGSKPFTFWCVPVTENRMYWMLDELLDEPQDCPDVEDWSGVEKAAQEMCEKYRLMESPLDGILLGELFDLTPHGTIAVLPREEGFFSTWAHGKVALMGDGKINRICEALIVCHFMDWD
ncbi:hypothetical protein BGX26_005761 [Mortierella sp. AD094]|nr:hypothetical protein BGX26_005761 [Mortierella sp. AD094]